MPNTPINALPVPDDNSPNLPPIHFDALADQLDSRLVPRFANVAARDAAITAPVEGMVCHVAAQVSPALPPRLMVYSEGKWRLVGPSPLRAVVAAWSEPAGQFGTTPAHLTTVNIPDPGFPYRLSAVVHCELGAASTGTRWDLWLRTTGGNVANLDMDRNIATTELTSFQRITTGITDQIYTGSCSVIAEARRAYGTANGNITALNRRLHVSQHAA